MSGDAKWTIGIILPSMLGMFLIFGNLVNARFDDVNARFDAVNIQIGALRSEIQNLRDDMREIRTLLINHVTDYEIHQPPEQDGR